MCLCKSLVRSPFDTILILIVFFAVSDSCTLVPGNTGAFRGAADTVLSSGTSDACKAVFLNQRIKLTGLEPAAFGHERTAIAGGLTLKAATQGGA